MTLIAVPDRTWALLEIAKRDSEERKRTLGIETKSKGPEIGSTGLEVFGGIISGNLLDHNRDWLDYQRFKTVDLMRRGDSTVAAGLQAVTLPILAASAKVVTTDRKDMEAPVDPVVIEAGEFVNDLLFSNSYMSQPWGQFLREALQLHLAYGCYPFEKVFMEITGGGRWDGAIGWRKFAPRHPSTIERWYFDRNGGKAGVQQLVTSDASKASGKYVYIPIEKLLIFTNQEEAGNPLGMSIFRPAYKHWKYKDGFYAVQAIAIERQGAGVPYARHPQGTHGDELEKAEEMLQNVQAHEQSYFLFAEDWEVGFLNMGSQTTLNPRDAIEHHDMMIAKSVLAGFMQLPQDSQGSFALSENMTDFFNHAISATSNYIADVINMHAIPQIVDMNWPGLNVYPRLQFDRIGHLSLDRTLNAITEAVKDGVLTPDLNLENRVRDLLNLPPIDEEDFEEAEEKDIEEPDDNNDNDKEKEKTEETVNS